MGHAIWTITEGREEPSEDVKPRKERSESVQTEDYARGTPEAVGGGHGRGHLSGFVMPV